MGALKDGLGGGSGLSGIEDEMTSDVVWSSTSRIYFRDAGLNIYSSADGQLDITADTTIALSGAVTADSTLAVTGVSTLTGQLYSTNPVKQQTITNIDAQSSTPTIAQILGGVIIHTSVTGAGTATVPTGTAMSTGVSGVAVGSTIEWLYYNDGDQTVTITAATGHTLVGGTAAVTTGKWMRVTSINTAANTWVSYLQTLM